MSSNTNPTDNITKWEVSNVGGISTNQLNAVEVYPESTCDIVDICSSPLRSKSSSLASTTRERDITTHPLSHDALIAGIQSLRQDMLEVQERNKALTSDLRRLEAKHLISESKIDENTDYIYFLEREVARLDQYGRRENIELLGIPNTVKDSELEGNVLSILRQIGLVHLQHYNIAACHRLRTKDRFGNYNTIVRFTNRKDSISCLKSKKNLHLCRDLGFKHLYITENLCPSNRSIFNNLSDLKRDGEINKVWSYNGTVHFKFKDDPNEKPKKVYHECDLNFYFNDSKRNE